MSDSEDASSTPSNAQIESILKRIVARTYKTNHDELTVKRVRKAIEDELDLPADWLKQHDVWAARSKELITSEVERLDAAGGEDDEESEDNAPVTKKPLKKSNGAATARANASKKRKAAGAPKAAAKAKPRKKQRVSSDEEDEALESEAQSSVGENDTPSPPAKRVASRPKAAPRAARSKAVVDSDDEDEEEEVKAAEPPSKSKSQAKVIDSEDGEEDDDSNEKEPVAPPPPPKDDGHDSESSLSSLLDEPPKKKRQKKAPQAKTSKAKSKTTSRAKPAHKKDTKDLTPDDEEIKRLQGWLLKCGIRKVWGKELKPFETPKAKIAHLKGMLADVGMTGRYSVDKARQIKEQRELAADLEAVTDFDRKWGQQEEEGRRGRAKDLGLDPSLLADGDSDDE